MIRRPPRSTLSSSSAASDVYKRQKHDEWIDMGQFPKRKRLDVYEYKDNGSKHKRQVSLFADCMVCMNGFKFKWFRPIRLLANLKVSTVDDTFIMDWSPGHSVNFNLSSAASVRIGPDELPREVVIDELRARVAFVAAIEEGTQQSRRNGQGPPGLTRAKPLQGQPI
eukprot:TRINITY_DN34684_c0_g1_i3.p2 TRINITY_DN34684_c0_g1~~TRINITY_DN34684_c0_g1_i3.p2  ORF type:complete len:167 (-),score=36.98 TRINITY_DN34684_c0_g1_i3:347-847(-)